MTHETDTRREFYDTWAGLTGSEAETRPGLCRINDSVSCRVVPSRPAGQSWRLPARTAGTTAALSPHSPNHFQPFPPRASLTGTSLERPNLPWHTQSNPSIVGFFLLLCPLHRRTLQRLVREFNKVVVGVAMASGRSSAADETVAPARGRRWIDRQAVDRGIAYALMVAALVATYALH
ncbi:hypothetical protein PR202_ga06876 [Eleusine coracana subsp. coracana]|uniref:Uncharacterized protein n=1 Tax=Eleusine coracana subsp. coracana TaxID=191504 RepID=A0AAV5BYG0_ELECO|nr:hypothetical protein PR202_ga06876 [Eleusine coracana subsp. coracana]